MTDGFTIDVVVRGYETDANAHVNHTVYHQYAEHGRTEMLRAAGVDMPAMAAAGVGPVLLESTVRFLAELRVGDEVQVTTSLRFGAGKTFRMDSELRRGTQRSREYADREAAAPEAGYSDTLCATISGTMGLLDHATRRLVADPRARLAAVATDPERLERLQEATAPSAG